MDILVDRGCGIDVHKATVVACIMGTGIKKEIRTFTTMTNDRFRLKDWLKANRITHAAMESTGVCWKPVFNTLRLKGADIAKALNLSPAAVSKLAARGVKRFNGRGDHEHCWRDYLADGNILIGSPGFPRYSSMDTLSSLVY